MTVKKKDIDLVTFAVIQLFGTLVYQ